MSRIPDIDEFLDDDYEVPIRYIEEDDWQEGWAEETKKIQEEWDE